MKENVTMQIIRCSILGILWSIALILLCGEPIEDETWFRVFFITKGLAFFVGYIAYKLFVRWESKGLLPDTDDDI